MAKVLRVIAVVAGAVALVATGVGAVIGTGTAAAAAASATASTIATIATLVAGVAGIGAQLLTKPPPARGSVTETIIEVDPPSPYLMGEGYFAGVMRHRVGYGPTLNKVPNPYLWEVMALCVAGPIAGPIIPQVDFGAVPSYYSGWLATDTRLGARPDTSLVPQLHGPAPGWGGSSHLSSVAAIGWNYKFDKDGKRYASGLPTRGAIAKWVKVYDPRQDSTRPGGSGPCRLGDESTYVWDGPPGALIPAGELPALHAGTYAFGRYVNGQRVMGVGLPDEGIDWEGVAAWANDCEANGWRMFGAVFEGAPDDETRRWANLREICVAGGAEPLFSGAVLGFHWQRPRVALDTIYTSDLADAAQDVTAMQSWRDRLNTVRPRYTSPEHNWELVQAEAVQIPAYVEDDGQIRAEDIPFNFVKDKDQAAQLAAYWLVNSREITPITLTVMPRLRAYRPGECLHLALPDLGLDHDAIILRRKFDPATMTVELTLVTEDPGKHDFALGRVGVAPPPPSLSNTAEGRDNITRAARAPYWPEVDGPGRPEDGATRGAPIGTEVAGLPAEDLVEQAAQTAALADTTADAVAEAQQDIADLFSTYGSTASAASSAAAAATSQSAAAAAASTAATASSVAQSALDNAQAARDQAQAARDLAQSYQAGAQAAQGAAQTASSEASSARSAAEAAQGAATTQASNAAASASAANTSASNASSSASAASSSASAASASATQAASQASQAGVYASQAATSASDAAGYSSSAFSSSQVAAGARDAARNTLARQFPPTLDPESRTAYRTDRITHFDGPGQAAWGWPQPYLATAQASEYSPAVFPRYGIPTIAGRRYRAVCWVWANTHTYGDLQAYVYFAGNSTEELGAWEGSLSPNVLTAPAGAVTGANPMPVQAWLKLGVEYVAEAGWPAFHRPIFTIQRTSQWDLPLGTYVHFTGIEFEDVTSEVEAAQSASASASAASSAAASQTAASQSASAAQTSATNASTSAGQAATSAGQASTSASNASTSASSASTSASNAAGSASTAATQATNAANSASAAAGSASAASGSASTAATHASNAGLSATSAQNSATSASTSASNAAGSASSANTSAGQASTSASNAAGSASAAASSASVAASARDGATQALQTTFPQYLSPETQAAYVLAGQTGGILGPSTDWPVPYITYTAPNTSGSPSVYFAKGIPAIPGKRYRVMAWVYTAATNNPYYTVSIGGSVGPEWAGAWTVDIGSFGGLLNGTVPPGTAPTTNGPLARWTFTKVGFEFTIPNDPQWAYWRPFFQVLGNGDGSQALNDNTHLTGIIVEDITSEAASKGFADASASSASNAAASQTAAANSASSSQTSATNAATSAGQASTSAGQAASSASSAGTSASNASTSASNAAGSAATASQQATIASQAATNAANSASAAAGSASTASTQATLAGQSASAAASSQVAAASSASGALDAFAAMFPSELDPQGRQAYIRQNHPQPNDFRQAQQEWGWPRAFMIFTAPNAVTFANLIPRVGMPSVPGRRYRATAWAYTTATNAIGSIWPGGTPAPDWNNAAGLSPPTWVGTPSGYYDPLPSLQWVKLSFEYEVPTSGWPAYHRVIHSVEGQGGALINGEVYQSGVLFEDITSEAAASTSASAAATSASQAATSATSAGSSATSATNAANTASTAAGNASASASAASGSSASAASSASTAGSHAANALTYSNQSASFRDQAQSSASNAAASASSASASESSAANSAAISAQFQGAANLLTNTDFAVDLSGWEAAALSGANTTWSRNLAGDDWRPIPENSFGLYQNGRVGTGDATGQIVQRVPVEPGQILQVSAWIAAHRCDVNVGIALQDANFQWIAGWTFTNLARASGGQSLSSWTRIGVTTGAAPSNARYAAFHLYKYDTDAGQTDSYAWMARPQISFARAGQTLLNHFTPGSGRATAATFSAGLLAEESARASAIASEASARTALAATVSSQGSTITQQASVIATLQSQAATFEQRLVAGTTNYLRNGSFELGNFTFWTPGGVSGGFAVDQGSIWGNYAYYSHPTGASGFPFLMQDIAWPEQHWLTASASLNAWSTSGDVVTYLEVMWLNASGVEIGSRSYSPQVANAWFGSTDNRRGHTVTGLAPVGTVRARVLCVAHSPSGTLRLFGVRQVKAEVGTTATPYSNEATVNYQAGVIADHDGKLQAYLQQGVSAGAAAAWIKMIAKDVNGNPTSSIGMEAQEIVMTNSVGNLKRVAMRLADGNATFGGDVIFGGRLLFANGLALRLAVQPWVIQVHDGQSITYPNAGYLPAAAFQPTGLSPLGSGETYSLYLENQTASGATVRLKINVPGVPANFNLTSDYAGGSPQRAIFKGTNPDAIGNSYRMIATYTSGANAVLEGVNYWVAYFSINLEVYAYVGSNWVVIGSFFTVDQQSYSDGGYKEITGTMDVEVTAPSGVTHFGASGLGATVVNQITSLSWTAPGTPGSVRSASPNGEKCQLTLNY